VKDAEGSVRRTQPTLGLQGQTASEVLEGLAQGDEVAVKIILPTAAAKKKKP
jgi:hypothetical protein